MKGIAEKCRFRISLQELSKLMAAVGRIKWRAHLRDHGVLRITYTTRIVGLRTTSDKGFWMISTDEADAKALMNVAGREFASHECNPVELKCVG